MKVNKPKIYAEWKEEELLKFTDSLSSILERKQRCHKPNCPKSQKYGPSPDVPINEAKDCPNAKISRACAGYGR